MSSDALGIFQFSNLGEALKELNSFAKILELIPMGERTTALIVAPREALNQVEAGHKAIIEKPHPRLLPSYYSLENSNLESHVLVCESKFVGDLFLACNEMLENGLKVVDLRVPRGESSFGYLMMTSEVEIPNLKYKSNLMKINQVKNLGNGIKDYYNILP